MSSATERLRTLTTFRSETRLGVGEAIKLLNERYRRVEGWLCRECDMLVTDVLAHEKNEHGPVCAQCMRRTDEAGRHLATGVTECAK